MVRVAQEIVPMRAESYSHHVATFAGRLYEGGERLSLELR